MKEHEMWQICNEKQWEWICLCLTSKFLKHRQTSLVKSFHFSPNRKKAQTFPILAQFQTSWGTEITVTVSASDFMSGTDSFNSVIDHYYFNSSKNFKHQTLLMVTNIFYSIILFSRH